MGFLTMLGLMRVEDHNRIVAKQDALIDRATEQMKGEDFDRGTNHADRVGLIMARLRASRTRFDKAVKDLAAQSDEIAALKMSADLDNDTIRGLRAQLEAAEQVIVELKPDAEKFRAKAKADAERKKEKRAAAKKGAA